ncbi:C-type lectin lectoxin-Lio1-like isoform X4 [Saccostrea echinata]|uniref:C-type lectin lectoxin-Lio1-like isoform X4 n=1 Tax=Saccostrea echinata TaxID=191078 RepID=UPI002A82FE51|nr:C-type lectin lectoxin-Lio1-like isoform X4 [Saccostrea echinata]
MKNISDLHFQLFSSIQERAKIIKTAVFETQCSESGCTFDACDKRKPLKSVCSQGWKRYNGHCYHLFSTKMNWFEAQMFCRKQGATLLQINDARESKWLSKKFPKVPYWIDLTDVGKEGTWMTFSSGKGPTFTAWAKGQPDNSGGKQHCAYNNWTGRSDWDDGGCTYKTQVMCELSGSGF